MFLLIFQDNLSIIDEVHHPFQDIIVEGCAHNMNPPSPLLLLPLEKFLELIRAGLLPSPCFYNFLARTTFVLESLPEAKNPGQDAFWGDFVFNNSNS